MTQNILFPYSCLFFISKNQIKTKSVFSKFLIFYSYDLCTIQSVAQYLSFTVSSAEDSFSEARLEHRVQGICLRLPGCQTMFV